MAPTKLNVIHLPYGGSASRLPSSQSTAPRQPRTPLIVLHGWGNSAETIKPLAELLTDQVEVFVIDLPGFGHSEAPPSPWGTKDYASRINMFMEEQGIPQAFFLGHSFGGKTSIALASEQPEKVAALILLNSSGLRGRPPFRKQVRIRFIRALRTILRFLQNNFHISLYDNWFVPRFASPDYKNAGPLRETFVKIVNEDLSAEAQLIRAKTLLLWGSTDSETPLEMAKRLKQYIRNSELVILEGKGHLPFLDAGGASLCAFHVKQFLKNLLPEGEPQNSSN